MMDFTDRELGIEKTHTPEFEAKQKSAAIINFEKMLKKEEEKLANHNAQNEMMTATQLENCEKAIKQFTTILKTL